MSTPNEPSAQFQSIDPDSMRVDAIKFKAGTLFLGPPMRFEGEAEESAKVFFNHVVYIHSAEIREIQAKRDELQKQVDAVNHMIPRVIEKATAFCDLEKERDELKAWKESAIAKAKEAIEQLESIPEHCSGVDCYYCTHGEPHPKPASVAAETITAIWATDEIHIVAGEAHRIPGKL